MLYENKSNKCVRRLTKKTEENSRAPDYLSIGKHRKILKHHVPFINLQVYKKVHKFTAVKKVCHLETISKE